MILFAHVQFKPSDTGDRRRCQGFLNCKSKFGAPRAAASWLVERVHTLARTMVPDAFGWLPLLARILDMEQSSESGECRYKKPHYH